jgi:Mg2+-importing ATPase
MNEELLTKYKKIASLSKEEILTKYNTDISGLSLNKATNLLNKNGKNKAIKDEKKSWFYFLIMAFKDMFILILLFLAIINYFLGDKLGSLIIIIITLISALIRFFQEYSVYKFNQKLKAKIYSKAIVVRDNKEMIIKEENCVMGDIVKLNAGSIIPADLIIVESKDLFLNESIFTGESIPVEKKTINNNANNIFELSNICLMGASVISGNATGIIINTGLETYLGEMRNDTLLKKKNTNFDNGMKSISKMLLMYMIFVCLFVLIVDGIIKHNINEAILFALSVAVGITPSMLPMIVNVNLTKGSKTLAKKKTLVKRIESIQNLGAIDVLCTDKTGTLTENNITLQKYINVDGKEDNSIIEYAYLNSIFGTGMKNLVDRAIVSYAKKNNITEKIEGYEKIDELPFDYTRRRASVIVKNKNSYRMLTKGALESILPCCSKVKKNGKEEKITKEIIEIVNNEALKLANEGMQVIALAEKKEYRGIGIFDQNDEVEMTLIGFVGFLDPPKSGVKDTLEKLKKANINIKILTGDSEHTTRNICSLVGIDSAKIMLGKDTDKLTDKELKMQIDDINVYARLNPLEKERIIRLLEEKGHVVGYIGDGVNDALSLHQADVGISVNTATDIAKEASDLILLEKSLKVVYDGVIEGRKIYGNIIKYMKMALSDDFGDVFSIMIASIFLPFLPLLPIQMLFQDFIYDFSQIGIPYDNVDEEFLRVPHKWNVKGISKFMNVMGITSSVIDVLAFIIFWYALGYNSIDKQAYFQTAWFVMCLISELMIIHNVRTSKRAFLESNASKPLLLLTLFSMVLTVITPIILHNIPTFHFVILPLIYYVYMIGLIILYAIIVNIIKRIYIKKNAEWL